MRVGGRRASSAWSNGFVALAVACALAALTACDVLLDTHFDDLHLEADGGAVDEGGADAAAACDADASDFYVGATGAGSGPCLFSTITAATLAARRSHAAARVVHVANGDYGVASGETLPIDLRGGISLEGQGPATTTIEGVGDVDGYADMGATVVKLATILAGDESVASHVSGVRIVSANEAKAGSGVIGIYCNRGNAVDGRDQPPPSLVIDHVEVGVKYTTGIAVGNRLLPVRSGCNVRVTASKIGLAADDANTEGITVNGCGADAEGTYVAAQIGGDDASLGNQFSLSSDNAIGIGGCVSRIDVANNTFDASPHAISIDWGPARSKSWVSIRSNSFRGSTLGAIFLYWGVHIDELFDNVFDGNDMAAVVLWDHDTTTWPEIMLARRNTFTNNHVAVCLRGSSPYTGTLDFGTPTDHGANVFRCNSSGAFVTSCIEGTSQRNMGGDVLQGVPSGGDGFLSFAGNTWDHEPPTVSRTLADGLDYFAVDGSMPLLDGSTSSSTACSGRSVAGP